MTQVFNFILVFKSGQWGLLQPLWAAESFGYLSDLRGVDSSWRWRISGFLRASERCSARTRSHTWF